MSKQGKSIPGKLYQAHLEPAYNDMLDMMESDMEDYEIAAELGMTLTQTSRLRRELLED